jgi:hypothetical protein
MRTAKAHLMVTLLQSLLCQSGPTVFVVDLFGSLECNFQIATFDSQIKACSLVLNKVQCDLCNQQLYKLLADRRESAPPDSLSSAGKQ